MVTGGGWWAGLGQNRFRAESMCLTTARRRAAVTLAVRPEKISLSRQNTPEGDIRAKGRIAEWAYYGDISNLYVDLDGSGHRLSVVVANDTRARVHGMNIGDAVELAWSASDMLVLG